MYSAKNTFLLLLTAFIWGTAFVAQSVGLDYIGPFTLNGLRFFIGGFVLIPIIPLLDRMKKMIPKPALPMTDASFLPAVYAAV